MLDPYIIGWIASDGHVEKRYWLITQSEFNSDVLFSIKNKFCSSAEIIKQTKRKNSYGQKTMCILKVKNNEECSYLQDQWNIPIGNKTYSLKFPVGKSDHEIWRYLRGFFEGDGSISKIQNNSLRFDIISNINWIKGCFDFLKGKGFHPYISLDKRCEDIASIILRRRNEIHKIHSFIYGKSPDIYMISKYDKFLNFLAEFRPFSKERRYLSEEEKRKINQFLLDLSVSDISKNINCSKQSIWKIKAKITGGRKKMIDERDEKILSMLKDGKTFKYIQNQLGCGQKAIRKVRDMNFPSRQNMLNEKYSKIEEYIREGKSVKEIASELHCSFDKISEIRKNIKNEKRY